MARRVTPRCLSCEMEEMKCFSCREKERERKIVGTVVVLSLCVALLVLGFISAHGEWIRMNG